MTRRTLLALAVAAGVAFPSAAHAAAPFTPWCGTPFGGDRADAVSALQIHVVYAVPADATDRFAAVASLIATDLASIDAWWRLQDSARAPRFDLASFPGCGSTFGALDISSVRLPGDSAAYVPEAGRYRLLRADLTGLGFADPDKKYLVYYDGPVQEPHTLCGQSTSDRHLSGGRLGYSIVYLAGLCANGFGAGGITTLIAAHELLHGLGAVPTSLAQPAPPNACLGDRGHVCDNADDILSARHRAATTLDTVVLDAGRDDYYGHAGAWWDARDSLFLQRLDSLDQNPPSAPEGLTATSRGSTIRISWQQSVDAGPVQYRFYEDGEFVAQLAEAAREHDGAEGVTFAYTVRAVDAAGFLSPPQTIRFRVGLGLVDPAGRLVRDTVAPPPIATLRAQKTRRALVLSWPGVGDPGGLRGYRVERDGRLVAFVRRPRLLVWPAGASGRWTVRAVDRAGNFGDPATLLVR